MSDGITVAIDGGPPRGAKLISGRVRAEAATGEAVVAPEALPSACAR